MLVIFRHLKAVEDFLDFSSAYIVTVALRCTIVSFVLLAVVMIIRSTIIKNTVFLKGMIWSLVLLFPFFGTLKASFSDLIDLIEKHDYIILEPKKKLIDKANLTRNFYCNHIYYKSYSLSYLK